MNASTIATASSDLKSAVSEIKTAIKGNIAHEAEAAVIESLEKITAARDVLADIRDEISSLQDKIRNLEQSLAQRQLWNLRLENYTLAQTPGGAVVLEYQGTPKHYACPSCVNNQKLEILQDNRTSSGLFRCVACEAKYPINPSKPPPSIDYGPLGRRF